MKTIENMLYELAQKGYSARLLKEFNDSIDKNKEYKTIYIEEVPDKELIKTANQYNLMWCAVILHTGKELTEKIAYHTMPSDMKSFDFGEIVKYYVREGIEYGCTVYQVINSSTGIVVYYDKDKEVAERFCKNLIK